MYMYAGSSDTSMPATERQRGVGGERKLPAQFNLINQHSIVFLYITNCMYVSTSCNTILRCILYKDIKHTLLTLVQLINIHLSTVVV